MNSFLGILGCSYYFDHYIISSFFDPLRGGDLLLFQHLFHASWDCLKVDDCLLKTTGSANEILNILLEQWIMFGQ
jgi:hypothetical protein